MKPHRPFVMLLACCMAFAGPLCDTSTVCAAEDRILTPLYTPDRETTSSLSLTVSAGTEFSMTLFQHSEEREALAMYTVAETPTENTNYYCIMLEPGVYTLRVSMPAISGCTRLLTQELQFSINAPDYATDYSASKIVVTLLETMDDTQEIGCADAEVLTDIQDGTQHLQTNFIFNGAAGILGDVDSDHEITAQDALMTLQAYISSIMGSSSALSTQQEICADIDGDSTLSTNDALSILQYYTQSLMGHSPSWDALS